MAKITKEELLTKLREIEGNPIEQHEEADDLLLEYIDDVEITEAYDAIHKWYA